MSKSTCIHGTANNNLRYVMVYMELSSKLKKQIFSPEKIKIIFMNPSSSKDPVSNVSPQMFKRLRQELWK